MKCISLLSLTAATLLISGAALADHHDMSERTRGISDHHQIEERHDNIHHEDIRRDNIRHEEIREGDYRLREDNRDRRDMNKRIIKEEREEHKEHAENNLLRDINELRNDETHHNQHGLRRD